MKGHGLEDAIPQHTFLVFRVARNMSSELFATYGTTAQADHNIGIGPKGPGQAP